VLFVVVERIAGKKSHAQESQPSSLVGGHD